VTLSEAYHYSYNHTVSTTARSWGGVQHPSYQFRIQGEGDIVLADLNTRSEGILLENALSGHITIVDKKNNIVADLMKDSNNNMMIALNPGIYKVYNVKGKRHFEASAKVQSKGLSTVAHSHFRPIKPHAVTHKGAERFNFRPVIGVTGGYMHVNVSLLEKALKKQFSSFNHFNIAPSFSYNSNVYGAISGQIQLPNGLEGTMDIGATTLSGKHRTYNGVRNNKQNNRNYNYVLSISDDMELVLLSVSAGYRFRSGVLKNALIHAGATSYNVKHTTKTSFDDTQFDITIDNEYSITGNAVVPFIGIGYALPLWRFGEIRSIARYRHQHKPKHFTDERNGISLPFDFSGIDFMMHVQYYLIR